MRQIAATTMLIKVLIPRGTLLLRRVRGSLGLVSTVSARPGAGECCVRDTVGLLVGVADVEGHTNPASKPPSTAAQIGNKSASPVSAGQHMGKKPGRRVCVAVLAK